MRELKVMMISGGGKETREVNGLMPTVMAAWYIKSTYASRPTPYIVEITDEQDKSEECN